MTQESLRSIPPLLGNDRGQFKIHVIGNSGEPCHYASLTGFILETGAGKSTLSAQLSELLNIPVISLDKLFWRPNWVKAPDEEFRNSVRDGINQDTRGWIIDGNYSSILGAHISEEATDIIWLDPPLLLYFPRIFLRTMARIFGLVPHCSPGCPETVRECFFSKSSILLWCLTHHSVVRKWGGKLMQEYGFGVGHRSNEQKMRRIGGWGSELRRWLADVRRDGYILRNPYTANFPTMEVETTTPSGQPTVDRSKTTLFLIRTFVKIGGFHRLTLFEDGTLPTTDEHQIFTWKDATLREVVTTLRNVAAHVAEYRHPLARFSFKTVYADSGNKGRFAQKELGMVYSRDILGEPGSLNNTAPRLLEDVDGEVREPTEREKEERTLEELRFVPGDYLLVSVILPKNVTMPSEAPSRITGPGVPGGANGWKKSDSGWGSAPAPGTGRGGGHWRGDSNPPPPVPRGRGGRGGGDVGRDRDRDRRVPPPRRNDSPPQRGGWGDRRGGRVERRSRSRSRSRSPLPRRRNPRYD